MHIIHTNYASMRPFVILRNINYNKKLPHFNIIHSIILLGNNKLFNQKFLFSSENQIPEV